MVDETRHVTDVESSSSHSSVTNSSTTRTSVDSTKPSCVACSPLSALEEEAVLAVREASPAVNVISISEMLPRTADLLFLNVTTLEGQTFCIELCAKGYRIASARQDCMNGDFRQLDLHTKYFESIYSLLDSISPAYRAKFASLLSDRLARLAPRQDQEAN